MKQEIEHEKRAMLTEQQYNHIINDVVDEYGAIDFINIVNFYFENEISLIEKHIVLRIRVVNEADCEIQMKIKGQDGDQEYHEQLNHFKLNSVLNNGLKLNPEMFEKLKEQEIEKNFFKHKATLSTKRVEIECNNYLLVIDKNTYLNFEDYNLEIEAPSNEIAEQKIKEYCLKYNIKYDENYLSKTRRVFQKIDS